LQGDRAYSRKDWGGARDHYSNAIRVSESAPAVLLKRARSSYHLSDLYECIADTGRVLKLEPESLAALELRGGAYYVLGECAFFNGPRTRTGSLVCIICYSSVLIYICGFGERVFKMCPRDVTIVVSNRLHRGTSPIRREITMHFDAKQGRLHTCPVLFIILTSLV